MTTRMQSRMLPSKSFGLISNRASREPRALDTIPIRPFCPKCVPRQSVHTDEYYRCLADHIMFPSAVS